VITYKKEARALIEIFFGAILITTLLAACDSSSDSANPPEADVTPDTGSSGEEVSAQEIGLEGKWETYCEYKGKYTREIKGSDMEYENYDYSDNICTQGGAAFLGGDPTPQPIIAIGPSRTTPSGLTAYPIKYKYYDDIQKDLIVIQGDTLYWARGYKNDHPPDIDMLSGVFHRVDEFSVPKATETEAQ